MNALFLALFLGISAPNPGRVLTIRLHDVGLCGALPSGCKRITGDPTRMSAGTLQCDDATEWRVIAVIMTGMDPKRCDLRVRWGASSNKWEAQVVQKGIWKANIHWADANTIDATKSWGNSPA